MAPRYADVDAYVGSFPADVQASLEDQDSVHFAYHEPLPRDLVARTVALLHERHTRSAG